MTVSLVRNLNYREDNNKKCNKLQWQIVVGNGKVHMTTECTMRVALSRTQWQKMTPFIKYKESERKLGCTKYLILKNVFIVKNTTKVN